MIKVLALLLLLTGCEIYTHKERVIYEDGTPVQHAWVTERGDTFDGGTFTDVNGVWWMPAPPGIDIRLCIENPRDNFRPACYNGILQTPFEDGELQRIDE